MTIQLSVKGTLAERPFIGILLEAGKTGLTGMVRVENGHFIKVVYFQDGSVAFASSNEKSDRLTEVLKRAGKLTPEQVEDAQSRLRPNVSLGKTLVELGYISARDLLWGARAQVEGILRHLVFLTEGNYQIMEGSLPKEIINLKMSVDHVIFDAITRSENRDWILQYIGTPEAVYCPTPAFSEFDSDWKGAVEPITLRLDGKNSLHEIAQIADLDAFEVCKAVVVLQLLGLAELKKEQPVQLPLVEEAEIPEAAPSAERREAAQELGQILQIPTVEQLQKEQLKETRPSEETFALLPEPLDQEGAVAEQQKKGVERPRLPSLKDRQVQIPLQTIATQSKAAAFFSPERRRQWIIAGIIVTGGVLAGSAWYYFQNRMSVPTLTNSQPSYTKKSSASEPVGQPAVSQAEPGPSTPSLPGASVEPGPSVSQPSSAPIEVLQTGRIRDAARIWRQQLSRQRSAFTVQLLIACQEKTVLETFQMMSYSPELAVLPLKYKGQNCYRVIFGVFPSLDAAQAGASRLPASLLGQPSPPAPISLQRVLQ